MQYVKLCIGCVCLSLCHVSFAANNCGVGVLGNVTKLISKGLKQKDIPHLLSNLYSAQELRQFQSLAEKAASEATIVEQGFSRTNIYSLNLIEASLQRMLDKLSAQWGNNVPKLKLSVTSSLYYTAFVTRDAHILVPIGFLEQSSSDDELAFILAHELAHVLLGHARTIAKQERDKRLVREVKANLKTMTVISKIRFNDTKTLQLAEQERLDKINRRISIFHHRIQRSMMDVIHPIWNKKQEDEADLLGLELAFKAGYSPDGVANALQNISDLQKSGCEAIQQFGSDLKDFMRTEASPMLEKAANEESTSPLRAMVKHLKKYSSREAEKMLIAQALPKSHRKKEKRLEYVWNYTDRAEFEEIFAAVEDVLPTDEMISAIKDSKEYTRTLSSAHAVQRGYDAIQDDNLKAAANAVIPIEKNTQEGRLVLYNLRKSQGERRKAMQNLALALNADHPAREVMELYAEEHFLNGESQPVQLAVDKMLRTYGDEQYFLPEKIFIESSRIDGNKQAAADMLRLCIKSRRGYLDGPCRAAEVGTHPDFRTEYTQILAAKDCTIDDKAGGDVECVASNKATAFDFRKLKLFGRNN